MRRVSVAGLMGFVLASAVALAALRNANELWAGVLLLLATALVGVAVLGLIQGRGSDRAWWLGYAVFSGGYLALVFGPGFSGSIGSKLGTTQALAYVHSLTSTTSEQLTPALQNLQAQRAALIGRVEAVRRIGRSSNDPALSALKRRVSDVDEQIGEATGAGPGSPNWWRTVVPGAANYVPFLQVGHALFALVAGWIGAMISCRFRRRRGLRSPTGPASPA